MGEIKLKSKRNIGAGNVEYTYECFCVPRSVKTIIVTSGNQTEAQNLAQMECDEYCAQKTDKINFKETLERALILLEEHSENNIQRGACILNLPSGNKCIQLSIEECKKLNGVYIGGDCDKKNNLGLCIIEFRNVSGKNRFFYYYQADPGSTSNFCKVATFLGKMTPDAIARWYVEDGKVLFVNIYDIESCDNAAHLSFQGSFTKNDCGAKFDIH